VQMHDESRLRALAQHSSNDIVVIDSAGRLVYAVPSAEGKGVAGYTLLDLKGQNVMDLESISINGLCFESVPDARPDESARELQ
jgi:hypothetical protein